MEKIFSISAKHFRVVNSFRSTDLDLKEMSKIHVKQYANGVRIYGVDGHKLACCYDTTQQIDKDYSFTPTKEMVKAMNLKKARQIVFFYDEENKRTAVYLDVEGARGNVDPMPKDIDETTGALKEGQFLDVQASVDIILKGQEIKRFSKAYVGFSVKNLKALESISPTFLAMFGEKDDSPIICRFPDMPEILAIVMPNEIDIKQYEAAWREEFPCYLLNNYRKGSAA